MGGIVLLVQNKSQHERVKSLFFLRGQLVEIQYLKGMLTHPVPQDNTGFAFFHRNGAAQQQFILRV